MNSILEQFPKYQEKWWKTGIPQFRLIETELPEGLSVDSTSPIKLHLVLCAQFMFIYQISFDCHGCGRHPVCHKFTNG